MDKEIEFYTHGLHRMIERGLMPSQARELIKFGLRLTPQKKDHEGVVRPIINQGWKFIVKETQTTITVITGFRERAL